MVKNPPKLQRALDALRELPEGQQVAIRLRYDSLYDWYQEEHLPEEARKRFHPVCKSLERLLETVRPRNIAEAQEHALQFLGHFRLKGTFQDFSVAIPYASSDHLKIGIVYCGYRFEGLLQLSFLFGVHL